MWDGRHVRLCMMRVQLGRTARARRAPRPGQCAREPTRRQRTTHRTSATFCLASAAAVRSLALPAEPGHGNVTLETTGQLHAVQKAASTQPVSYTHTRARSLDWSYRCLVSRKDIEHLVHVDLLVAPSDPHPAQPNPSSGILLIPPLLPTRPLLRTTDPNQFSSVQLGHTTSIKISSPAGGLLWWRSSPHSSA